MRLALLGEGSSDRLLLPSIGWLSRKLRPAVPCEVVAVDFRGSPNPPRQLHAKLSATLELGDWDAVLLHRDSDSRDARPRYEELARAINQADTKVPTVSVVPIRMTEAWLLFDESAVRFAAGNSISTEPLNLPTLEESARRENPKRILHDALRLASGKTGRRLAKFNPDIRCHALVKRIDDWSPLLAVASFRRLHDELDDVLPGRD